MCMYRHEEEEEYERFWSPFAESTEEKRAQEQSGDTEE